MKKISKKSELIDLNLPEEVKDKIRELIDIYDKNYSAARNIDTDLGGFVLLLEVPEEFTEYDEMNHFIDYSVPEYVDTIVEANDRWYDVLFLLSSDYSISLITHEKAVPEEILEKWRTYQ